MTFIGRIRRGSHLHRLWHGQTRVSGVIDDITFRFIQGGTYESAELTPAQVKHLQAHPDVELVTLAAPLPTAPVAPPPGASFAARAAAERRQRRNQGLKVW